MGRPHENFEFLHRVRARDLHRISEERERFTCCLS